MTRKDYIAIAAAMKLARPRFGTVGRSAWAEAVQKIADYCQSESLRFDRSRFETACGLDNTP